VPIRVALSVDPGKQGVHADVAAAVRAAGNALAGAGYAVEEVGAARRPGRGGDVDHALHQRDAPRHPALHPQVRRRRHQPLARLQRWPRWPDVDLDGYLKALALRSKHVRDWTLFLERYSLVVGPVSTEPPFEVGFDTTSAERHAEVSRAQRLLVAVNLLGFPAVSVPTGVAGGLPLGVQVIAARLPRGPVPGRGRGDRGAAAAAHADRSRHVRHPVTQEEAPMAGDSIYRVTDLVGTSKVSWEDAVKNAVTVAGRTLRDLRVAEVTRFDVTIEKGKVTSYRAPRERLLQVREVTPRGRPLIST